MLVNSLDGNQAWINLEDLSPGDVIVGKFPKWTGNSTQLLCTNASVEKAAYNTKSSPTYTTPDKLTKELSFVLGVMLADGSFTSRGVSVSSGNSALIEEYEKQLRVCFPNAPISVFKDRNNITVVALDSKYLLYWINLACGNSKKVECKAKDKQVPEIIRLSPKEYLFEFLRGYLSCDSELTENSITICSASKEFIRQIQSLLTCFKIAPSHYKNYKSAATNGLNIYRKYHELTYSYQYMYPLLKQLKLFKILPSWKSTQDSLNLDTWFTTVSKVKKVKKKIRVYDVSVPQKEHFIADGLVNHNTYHVSLLSSLFGLSCFDILLSESTKPDSIFGPMDVPALASEGIQKVKVAGYAPDCEVLFFDEIFKANAIVLNPLLWLINEHRFRNGDEGVIECPTKVVFAASNEIPTDDALKAIYDRLMVRFEIEYIKNEANLHKMLSAPKHKTLTPILTREEVQQLIDATNRVIFPLELEKVLFKIRHQISIKCGFPISDRRLNASTRVIKAMALIQGSPIVQLEHMTILANIFWNQPEHIKSVRAIVGASTKTDALDLLSYKEMADEIWQHAINTGELDEAVIKLDEMKETVSQFKARSALETVEYIKNKSQYLRLQVRQRKYLYVTKMIYPKHIEYRLRTSSAMLWSQNQLRSVDFHFKRSGEYWYHYGPGKIDEDKYERAFKNKVLRLLGVKLKIVSL